ncbi:MAG: hypothetical protein HY698_07530 [Deltaproteobacteria bacterium]|nr:hypothetical protein [Deltaproteobacteria bacterium]
MYIRAGESSWRTIVFRVDSPIAVVSVVNNVLHRTGGRPDSPGLALMNVHGKAVLGVNWISEGWREGHEQDWAGTVEGTANLVTGSDPGLDLGNTMAPLPGSPVIDRAGALPGKLPQALRVNRQYVPHMQGKQRTPSGSALDLGAFERKQ